MSKIKKADNQPNFPKLEENITSFWKENKIFEKSVEQRPEDRPYVFVDGPPFVTGTPHYGSLLPSIAKDIIPRYQAMQGKRVRRVFGWDCHGLPIEEKINKKFGILSSAQLEEEMGVEKYVQECRKWVESCSDEWRWYIEKVGRWVDMDNAYYTMHPEFMESVIWSFKQMYEKGYVYKGKRVSMFSTDTSTPVSEFEVAMDQDNYRDVEDLSIFVKFKLVDDSKNQILKQVQDDKVEIQNLSVLAWTTTPWTIPSNFGLAVNPEADYVLVKFEGEYLILGKSRLEYTFQTKKENIGIEPDKLVQIISEFKGLELEGLKYEPVYNYFVEKSNENDFKINLYEGVTTEDGTGVLHVAPAFGEEDFNLGKKFGLSDYADIDEEGKMIVGDWKGIYLRNACEQITEDLEKIGKLFRSEMHTHRLPFYRGANPLIYMAQEAIFVDIQKIKSRMLELNQDINWIPESIKEGRFAQTVQNSPDWSISRNRYWATIIPIWRNENGDEIVIGSFEDFLQYTDQIKKSLDENGKPHYEFEGQPMDLHRDVCDKIILKKDGKEYKRIPEVLDCWMDSGSVPFAEYHYPFENKEAFEKGFPADYIIEYVGQIRAWFTMLLRVSTMVFDKVPFQNVIVTGNIAGNDGRKMSKSFGNYPDPKMVLEKIGGEALRLYLMSSSVMVGEDIAWSDELLNEQVKNILIPLWNTYKYFTIYADLHNFTPTSAEFNSKTILDKWLETLVKKTVLNYSNALEKYNIPESVKLIQPVIDNVSAWWIRRSRDRFAEGDVDAMQNLYAALVMLIKTFAPQMAFVTEEMYQNLVVGILEDAKESVHLEDFPIIDEKYLKVEGRFNLLSNMIFVREICSCGNSERVTKSIKSRQPLAKVIITSKEELKLNEEFHQIIKEELNVKEVVFKSDKTIEEELIISLDTQLTPDLREEGLYAEIKRQIQNLRKTSGLQMGEEAGLQLTIENSELRIIIKKFETNLRNDCGLSSIEFIDGIEGAELKIDDEKIIGKLIK